MAVLIEGMEMPKHDDEYVIFTVYGDGGVVYGPLNRPHVRYKHRAVSVPEPHGRLIDADKLMKRMWDETDCMISVPATFVRDAPTIIPSSGEAE